MDRELDLLVGNELSGYKKHDGYWCIRSHGINLASRYQRLHEMTEMLVFVQLLVLHGLHVCVEEVFFDSKAQVAFVTLHNHLKDRKYEIEGCASRTLSQYQVEDLNGHCEDLMPTWMKDLLPEDAE